MIKPIFVLGCHKSGTTLLRNLLDGTPDLFAIPIETHFFQHIGLWVSYELMYALPRRLDFEEVVSRLYSEVQESNSKPTNQKKWGDSFIPEQWNVDAFCSYLYTHGREYYEASNLGAFFSCVAEAMHFSLFGKIPSEETRFIEKSVENAEFAPILKNWYPEAKFIHIVRNPYATLVALRKFKSLVRGHYPFIAPLMQSIENSYYYLYKNQIHLSDYLVIRFEDLLADPISIMHKIASFCEINFDDIMLKPTYLNGQDWSGNSMSGKDFKGISTHPIHSWRKEITGLEIELVNQLFTSVLEDYDYEKIEASSSVWKKNKKEHPQYYIANRFYLKSITHSRGVSQKIRKEKYHKHHFNPEMRKKVMS